MADFSGGGCAYRKTRYLEIGGYVPIPTAYGMEEVDLACASTRSAAASFARGVCASSITTIYLIMPIPW